jgi:vacuolar protein sorting-associated protein 13A/C
MDGPIEFIEGIASGSRRLTGSVVGGIACAGCKITGVKIIKVLEFNVKHWQHKQQLTLFEVERLSPRFVALVVLFTYFFLLK